MDVPDVIMYSPGWSDEAGDQAAKMSDPGAAISGCIPISIHFIDCQLLECYNEEETKAFKTKHLKNGRRQ